MRSRPKSIKFQDATEALLKRMLPSCNTDRADRAEAWAAWQEQGGKLAVLKFIRMSNNTPEPDEDILQDALVTAYLEVERGRYRRMAGIPFTAYVKGIARNKIREARRRARRWVPLESLEPILKDATQRQPEVAFEHQERRAVLRSGMRQLPTSRREVLERYIRGEGTAEIAQALEMTEALVRQHKSRGLRRIQQMAIKQQVVAGSQS